MKFPSAEVVPLLREEATKRQGARHDLRPTEKTEGPTSCRNLQKVRGGVREIAAKQLGVSEFTVQGAMDVKKADPEEFERLKQGKKTWDSSAAFTMSP